MNAKGVSANRQIARAAGLVMGAFVLSQVMGLIYQIVATNAFGTEGPMDAFNAANRVSETLFNLVAGGALASAFIPTFSGLLVSEERQQAWKLASAVLNLVLIILAVLATLAAFYAPTIVSKILARGFTDNPEQLALTIELTRIMLPSAVIFGVGGLVMGILNSHQVFLFPALAPSMYRLGMVFGILFLSPRYGIYGLAYGVIIGSAMHLALQLPALLKQRARYFPTFGLNLEPVREVIRLMGPRLLGVAVVQINFLVNVSIASEYSVGSVTGVTYGLALMLVPQAIIAQSIAIASLPTFSEQFAKNKLEEMRASLASTLRGILYLSIPATIGLVMLRTPVVTMLYQRGAFDERSTELVAWALLWYGVGLVGHSMVEVLARAFYAMHDTRTPVIVGGIAMSLNIGLSFLFAWVFQRIGWMPHGGLALANTIATAIEMVGLLYLMRSRLNGLDGKRILAAVWQAGLASVVMGLALWFWLQRGNIQSVWIEGAGGILMGGAVYAAIIALIGVPEVRTVFRAVRQRLRGSG